MPRILIVEDGPRALEFMQRALKPPGRAIDTARNGAEALRMLDQNFYDLLVTDLMMPERTGFDLLEILAQRKASLPIVVCSAYVKPDALKDLGRGIRVEVVSKPFKAETLASAAKKLLAPPGEKAP